LITLESPAIFSCSRHFFLFVLVNGAYFRTAVQ
jgi:hypothetical protein